MLSSELEQFVDGWLERANNYSDDCVEDCYNKFFTLFVIFNRLYAEATFELNRRGKIILKPNGLLNDRKGATEYTLELITIDDFERLYAERLAINVNVIADLIESELFFIKLSNPDGNRQPEKDRILLADLRSSDEKRALAVLDLIYTVRCNLFHGHKAFQPVQAELLRPVTALLVEVINSLHCALNK